MRFLALRKILLLSLFLLPGCTLSSLYMPPRLYSADARVLETVGHMGFHGIDESSAMEKSSRFPDTYWTLNDSGGGPRIFAIRANGEIIKPDGLKEYRGIQIDNATNIDWEDLASDGQGHLYIADFGNNDSLRRNLAIYKIAEPDPKVTVQIPAIARIPFSYPDQLDYPPGKKDFDAEALFWLRGHLYLLTKHRSDTLTRLYRFDALIAGKETPLSLIDSFDIGGMVTAADASDDGRLLAILTYHDIWLIELPQRGNSLLQGKKYRLPIRLGQCEGICFAGDRLLLSNEEGDIFSVTLREIQENGAVHD